MNNSKKISITASLRQSLIVLTVLLTAFATAGAQNNRRGSMTDEQRQRALSEMRTYKHNMLVRELDLSKSQQAKFFDVYDQMDDELMTIADETRELTRRTLADADATDTEIAAASRAMFEQKKREAEVELKYYEKFEEILTPRQLLGLKTAERKIAMQMASYHARAKNRAARRAN